MDYQNCLPSELRHHLMGMIKNYQCQWGAADFGHCYICRTTQTNNLVNQMYICDDCVDAPIDAIDSDTEFIANYPELLAHAQTQMKLKLGTVTGITIDNNLYFRCHLCLEYYPTGQLLDGTRLCARCMQ